MKLNRIPSALTAAALTASLLSPLSAVRAEEESAKLRVMPLGDSITDGFTVPGGYRDPLWNLLNDAGLSGQIDFVGPNGYEIPGGLDSQHAGYSGYAIDDIPGARTGLYSFIDWLMESNPTDVVLLQIGTNDILSNYELDSAGARLELLVDAILTYLPEDGLLYVSTIPYMDADVTNYTDAFTVEEMDAAVDAYNADVRAVVAKKAAEGKPVVQADINSVLTKDDLGDGVHPSEDGYQKMAEYWFGVLDALLKGEVTAPTAPDTEPADTTTAEESTEPSTEESTEPGPSAEESTETSELPTDSTAQDTDEPAQTRQLGDVDADGTVSVADIILMQKFMLGIQALPTWEDAYYADLTQDGMVDIFDLALLKRTVFTRGD